MTTAFLVFNFTNSFLIGVMGGSSNSKKIQIIAFLAIALNTAQCIVH